MLVFMRRPTFFLCAAPPHAGGLRPPGPPPPPKKILRFCAVKSTLFLYIAGLIRIYLDTKQGVKCLFLCGALLFFCARRRRTRGGSAPPDPLHPLRKFCVFAQ